MMARGGQRTFGILAGGGSLPLEIAVSVRARGASVHIVAFRNEADADFSDFPLTWVYWGQVGAILAAFSKAKCTDLVIVGSVSRPDLGRLRPDFGLFAALPSALRILAAGGDDSVLRGVTKFFEQKGYCVVGPGDVAPELLIGPGPLGVGKPSAEDDATIAHGLRLLEALSPYDVGQTVVVSEDLSVEAIEGIEGTDAMLSRVAEGRRASQNLLAGGRGFLIKAPKRGQDMRVDLPAIGPDTVKNATEANLKGLALQAGHVLAANKQQLIANADAQGVIVVGVMRDAPAVRAPDEVQGRDSGARVEIISQLKPRKVFSADSALGTQVLQAVSAFGTGGAVVVTRGHVLGIETGEDIEALCQRIARRKQWGAAHWSRRRGVVVVRDEKNVTLDVVAAIDEAGFAGLAVMVGSSSQGIDPGCLAAINAAGLSAARVEGADLGRGSA